MASTYAGGVFGTINTPEVRSGGPANNNDSTAKMPIGATMTWNGARYRYVKFSSGTGTVAAIVGGPAYAKTLSVATATVQPVFTVAADQTDSVFSKTPVGVFISILTDTYFGFIQIGGDATVKVLGAVAGDLLTGGTTDNQFEKISEGSAMTQTQVGVVKSGTSAASLSTAHLINMDW